LAICERGGRFFFLNFRLEWAKSNVRDSPWETLDVRRPEMEGVPIGKRRLGSKINMPEYLRWEKKKFLRLSRNLEPTPEGAVFGWGGAPAALAQNYPGKSKWHVVADKLNPWWDSVVFDGCNHKKWDDMLQRLIQGYGADAGFEFKELFPHDETVGDPGASKIQKAIYKMGNKKSRGTDVDLSDILDSI
jgi:hypothetical protein